jgi:hypothetical protein
VFSACRHPLNSQRISSRSWSDPTSELSFCFCICLERVQRTSGERNNEESFIDPRDQQFVARPLRHQPCGFSSSDCEYFIPARCGLSLTVCSLCVLHYRVAPRTRHKPGNPWPGLLCFDCLHSSTGPPQLRQSATSVDIMAGLFRRIYDWLLRLFWYEQPRHSSVSFVFVSKYGSCVVMELSLHRTTSAT